MAGKPMDSSSSDSPSGTARDDNKEPQPETAAAKSPEPIQVGQSVPAKEPGFAIHLWIEGLSGEGTAPHHKEWIVVLAYRQSLYRPTASNEALQPTFEIEKNLDRSSPALYHAVHIGRVFDEVVIEVCRNTERSERFLRVDISGAVVTEVRQTAAASSESSRPVEAVVFEYQRIQWTYTKLRQPDAQREGHSSSSWTRKTVAPKATVRVRTDIQTFRP
jgi:type VI secretion system Hcp family effector